MGLETTAHSRCYTDVAYPAVKDKDNDKDATGVVLVLGNEVTGLDTTVMPLLDDLIEIPMMEHYKRLPEKVVQSYHWVLTNLPQVQWLVKADDDTYVRPSLVEHYLKKYNADIPMVLGKIVPHSPVAREGKWKEVDYAHEYYPYWPQGSAGHIVSKATAQYISAKSESLHRYQGEDVSIGIWMDEAPSKHKLQDVTYIQAKGIITNDGTNYCGRANVVMIGHDISPEEMYDCQEKFKKASSSLENSWLDDPTNWKSLYGSASDGGGWNAGSGWWSTGSGSGGFIQSGGYR